MNREIIENEIEQLLSNFSEQFERAKNYKAVPRIELDLMMETVRDLYEQLYKLNAENPLAEKKVVMAIPQLIEERKEVIENIVQPVVKELKPVIVVPEIIVEEKQKEENEIIVHHHEQEEAQVAASIKRENIFQEQTKAQTNSVASLFDDLPTIGDNYKEQQSLHHKIGKSKTERYSDKLQQQPVEDLKRSIGINEKFAFMNELFQSNQQRYSDSIDALNNFRNYEEAHAHLTMLTAEMKWNTTSIAYQELDELVKRRFGV